MQVVFHKKKALCCFFPSEYLKSGKLNKGDFSLLLLIYSSFFPKCLCTTCSAFHVLTSASGISTVGNCDLRWEKLLCHCLRGKSDSSVSTGSSSFSPLRVLLFTCSVDGFQLSQAAIPSWIPGFVQSSVLTLPLCSFCSVTCTSSTAQPGR